MPSKRVKYVQVEDRNPFSENFDPEDVARISEGASHSASYVPGYSNIVRENELAKSAGRYDEVKTLAHRFHWIRAKNVVTKEEDGRRLYTWKVQKQYETLDYDALVKLGYDLTQNPAITKGTDGKAWYGENILGCASASVAAIHWQQLQDKNKEQLASPGMQMDDAIDRFNTSKVAERGGMKASHFEFVEEIDKAGNPTKKS